MMREYNGVVQRDGQERHLETRPNYGIDGPVPGWAEWTTSNAFQHLSRSHDFPVLTHLAQRPKG